MPDAVQDATRAMDAGIRVIPAHEAPPDDLDEIFGTRGEPARCRCQWLLVSQEEFRAMPQEERREHHLEQAAHGVPGAPTTGLVAYLDGEPAGWCAVMPRVVQRRIVEGRSRIPWSGRDEDREDAGIWAVTCFVTRTGLRHRGVSRALAAAAVPYAREQGATAVEGYPMVTTPGTVVTWGELFVGSRSVFADAGFREVSRPTKRRVVMRLDL